MTLLQFYLFLSRRNLLASTNPTSQLSEDGRDALNSFYTVKPAQQSVSVFDKLAEREALAWTNARSDHVVLELSLVTFFLSRERK